MRMHLRAFAIFLLLKDCHRRMKRGQSDILLLFLAHLIIQDTVLLEDQRLKKSRSKLTSASVNKRWCEEVQQQDENERIY